MIELLVFGGWLFWSVIAVGTLVLFITVGNSKPGWSFILVMLMLFLAIDSTGSPIADWHWTRWAAMAGMYFVVGGIYAVAAWWVMVRSMRKFADKYVPNEKGRYTYSLGERLRDRYKADNNVSLPPRASDFKSRVACWIAYWPVSAVAYVFSDPLTNVVKFIYNRITSIMADISDNEFADFEEPKEK